MHVLQCHVPGFIERYGDLLNYNCHGFAHLDTITKEAFKKETSKQPGKRLKEGLLALLSRCLVLKYKGGIYHPST
jgi:hypothetical protein